MKLLILQLSDVHCTDENIEHNVRIDKIGSALRSIGNVAFLETYQLLVRQQKLTLEELLLTKL